MEMVTFLMEHNANVNRADSEGWTPLHVAASCGYPDIAECVVYSSQLLAEYNSATAVQFFATLGTPQCNVCAKVFVH